MTEAVIGVSKCPVCHSRGLESTVTRIGIQGTTLAHYAPHIDEQGIEHLHDYNKSYIEKRCSKGHIWEDVQPVSCYICGILREGYFIIRSSIDKDKKTDRLTL